MTLEECIIPDTWKVWVEDCKSIRCIAIFKYESDALEYGKENCDRYIITRYNTVVSEIDNVVCNGNS